MTQSVRIGVIGDYNSAFASHPATGEALRSAATALGLPVEVNWVATSSIAPDSPEKRLGEFDGLWISAGSPYANFHGALAAIKHARESDLPLLGTCGGFQHAVIELARNVLGIADADSAEHDGTSQNVVITPVACEVPDRKADAPKLSGRSTVRVKPGTLLHKSVNHREELHEEYFCNFEVNPEIRPKLEEAGVVISGVGPQDEVRAIELPGKTWYLATLFQPQLTNRGSRPHQIVLAFLEAVRTRKGAKRMAAVRK